jgi:hypothetical protein
MAADAIPFIVKQIDQQEDNDEVDFLIVSNGGDAITAQRIINLLREKYNKVNILIPYVAYSAATILSMGGDSIVMHKYSNLGPVDPQITTKKPNDKGTVNNLSFGSEDVKYFIEFLRKDAKIKNGSITSSMIPLINEAGPLAIGFSKRSQQLSLDLSKKLLKQHITKKSVIKKITKHLNTSFNHSYAFSRTEAKNIGLNVIYPDKELEDLLWNLWLDYESELKADIPFDLNNEIISDPNVAKIIKNYQTISMPVNLPLNMAQGQIQQLVNQNKLISSNNNTAVTLNLTLGCIESIISAYHFNTNLDITVWRNLDQNIGLNTFQSSKGWIKI